MGLTQGCIYCSKSRAPALGELTAVPYARGMPKQELLTLHTTPIRHTRAGSQLKYPFQRVVGIETDNATLLTRVDNPRTFDTRHYRTDRLFNTRLAGFFSLHLIRHNGEYSAHTFAAFMAGERDPKDRHYEDSARSHEIIRKGRPVRPPVALGHSAIMGSHYADEPFAHGAVVGLGKDVKDCLEVVGMQDFLVVGPYDETLDDVRHRSKASKVQYYAR